MWISVREQLPRTGEPVWVVYSGTVQTVAYKRMGKGFACEDGYEWETATAVDGDDTMPDEFVTHWMPIPAPPISERSAGE